MNWKKGDQLAGVLEESREERGPGLVLRRWVFAPLLPHPPDPSMTHEVGS